MRAIGALAVVLSAVPAFADVVVQLACEGTVESQGVGGSHTDEMSGSITIRGNVVYVSFMPEPCTVTAITSHGAQFICPQPRGLTDVAVGDLNRPWPIGSRGDVIYLSVVVTHLPQNPKLSETTTSYRLFCKKALPLF